MKFFRPLLMTVALSAAIPQYAVCSFSPEEIRYFQLKACDRLIDLVAAGISALIAAYAITKMTEWAVASTSWKTHKQGTIKENFASIAGNENAKEELRDIVDYLRKPSTYAEIGAKVPKGVLMQGPPGTGKTLLARAMAGEANCSFISASGSDFSGMFQAVGSTRIKNLFKEARKKAPCIIFIDEIDSLVQARGSDPMGSGKDMGLTLNQLLTEMDGFNVNQKPIIVIGSTNRLDTIDSAVLRPGRFDRIVAVSLPDVSAREKILAVHAKNIKIDPAVDLTIIAQATGGFSGADLANIINEAAIEALKAGKKLVEQADLEEALNKSLLGKTTKGIPVKPEERRITAYHEAGHALVSILLGEFCRPLYKVTIIPRGPAGGFTAYLPKEQSSYSKDEMLAEITSLFGGRAAEELVFNKIMTGASNDLQVATAHARSMICTYGMSDTLGPVTYHDAVAAYQTFSQQTARLIDEEVQAILVASHDRAHQLLSDHRKELDIIAEALLEKETLSAEEVYALIGVQPYAKQIIA
jgi:ATP-dependent metalloprotease FtsH